jgi:hypothetical protein
MTCGWLSKSAITSKSTAAVEGTCIFLKPKILRRSSTEQHAPGGQVIRIGNRGFLLVPGSQEEWGHPCVRPGFNSSNHRMMARDSSTRARELRSKELIPATARDLRRSDSGGTGRGLSAPG